VLLSVIFPGRRGRPREVVLALYGRWLVESYVGRGERADVTVEATKTSGGLRWRMHEATGGYNARSLRTRLRPEETNCTPLMTTSFFAVEGVADDGGRGCASALEGIGVGWGRVGCL
jgi:hypothetical protein